jgi:DNA-binding transcriptional ArsR family regulator
MFKHIKKQKLNIQCACPIKECIEILETLSDETRQGIVSLFADKKELCANDIAEQFTLSRPTISHHLNLMKRTNLLNSRKDGREIYYSLNKTYTVKLLTSILNTIKKYR